MGRGLAWLETILSHAHLLLLAAFGLVHSCNSENVDICARKYDPLTPPLNLSLPECTRATTNAHTRRLGMVGGWATLKV